MGLSSPFGSILFRLLLPLSILLIPTVGLTADSLPIAMTLEQALERGLAANHQVEAHKLGVDAAHEAVRGAVGAFLPTLSLSHGRTRLHNNAEAESNTDYLDQNTISSTATLSQPLFSGFAGIAGLRQARLGRELSNHELRYLQLRLAREIRRDFYGIIHARARVELWEQSLARLDRQLRIARAWYDVEMATRLRVLEVEVELANARQQLEESRASLAVGEARMAHWLALGPEDQFIPLGQLDENDGHSFPSLAESLARAREQRPDLRLAEINIRRAEQERRIIAARSLPRLELEGSWTEYDREYRVVGHSNEERDYYSVGLRLTMQPFQGGRNISAWRQQGIIIQRQQAQRREVDRGLETEVRTAHLRWGESYARLEAAAETKRQAEFAWRLAERSLELKVGSLRDTLEAELRLTRADFALLEARYHRQLSLVELIYALGD